MQDSPELEARYARSGAEDGVGAAWWGALPAQAASDGAGRTEWSEDGGAGSSMWDPDEFRPRWP